MSDRARRAVSFALSAALHALLLLVVYSLAVTQPGFPDVRPMPVRIIEPRQQAKGGPRPPDQVQVAAKPPEAAKAIEAPPAEAPAPQPEKKIPLPEQQIVNPSEAGRNEAPANTRLLSDRDTTVEKQTVKRGNPKPGNESPGDNPPPKPAAPKPAKPPQRPAPRGGGTTGREPPPRMASLPGLDRLMPDALRLAEEGYGEPADQPTGEQLAHAEVKPRRLQPVGSDGLLVPSSGPIGTMDFLPDVQEGAITLLNTKAEVFAPFVRRVAMRVFQNFWISLRRDLTGRMLPSTESIEAEAVMDQAGEMAAFTVHQRSPRLLLASDRRLQLACNDGFFDRNPPPGARAKDGRIHFVFRTAVQSTPSPQGMAYWVQLQAGLL